MQRTIINLLLIGIGIALIVGLFIAPSLTPWLDAGSVIPWIEKTLVRWGYLFIFLSATAEATLAVGVVWPGTAVVVLAGALAGRGNLGLTIGEVIATASAGLCVGYAFSFAVGFAGFATFMSRIGLDGVLVQTRHRVEGAASWKTVLIFGDVRAAAIVATALGAMRVPIPKAMTMIVSASLIWASVWVIAGACIGPRVITFLSAPTILALVISLMIVRAIRRRRVGHKDRRVVDVDAIDERA